MAMRQLATLAGGALPAHFSYSPYVGRKRISITPTAKAVVTQAASPVIVHGDGALPWTIDAAYPAEFQALYDLYNTSTNDLLVFEGYWGETLSVYFSVFDQPQVRGRLFNLSGQFQVVAVTTDYAAACGGA